MLPEKVVNNRKDCDFCLPVTVQRGEMIGKAIRQVRKQKGMTLDDVAVPCDVTAVTVSRYERGERSPSPDMVGCIAGVLGVSVDHLSALARELQPDLPEDNQKPVSGYAASERDRVEWRDAVTRSDLSWSAKAVLALLSLPENINKSLTPWLAVATPEQVIESSPGDESEIRRAWDEATSSPFVEPVKGLDSAWKLKFPE